MTIKAGQLIQDGTAVWLVEDVRDGARVGDIILRPTLRDGFIKANGATVKASEYPRLLVWVQEAGMAVTAEQYAADCSKYVYDGAADTLVLPNAMSRVLQAGEQVKSVGAGLPNIHTGGFPRAFLTDLGPEGKIRGALKVERRTASVYGGEDMARYHAMLDASLLSPIYGASETVQPPAITLIAQSKD